MASAFLRRYAARGYLTRRRRLVDGVALLVDAGGEAALGGPPLRLQRRANVLYSWRCFKKHPLRDNKPWRRLSRALLPIAPVPPA